MIYIKPLKTKVIHHHSDEAGNRWSDEMISFLCGMNKYRKKLEAQGFEAMPAGMIENIKKLFMGTPAIF